MWLFVERLFCQGSKKQLHVQASPSDINVKTEDS
jgi:hypothetical protein